MKPRYEDNFIPDKIKTLRENTAREMKDIRKEQKITQNELAEKIGTKKSNISRFESGKYNPTLDFMAKMADGLGKEIKIIID